MAGKSKFQISHSLDERIKNTFVDNDDSEFAQVNSAYILGFNYGNVTNYVGLATDYKSHHVVIPVVGLVFFKTSPTDEDIKSNLDTVKKYSSSPDGLGNFKTDKNEDLFLICTMESGKRIFDSSTGSFLEEQPKLIVLDDAKIYSHSVLVKLSLSIKLDICDQQSGTKMLLGQDKIDAVLTDAQESFAKDTKSIKFHLTKSNFSTSSSGNRNLTETLYDYLDAPNDLDQMGDYLPQLSKAEKAKMVEKWRNKMKTQRSPLELKLEHESLGVEDSQLSSLPKSAYKLDLEDYLYLQVNDSISKSLQLILFSLRQSIGALRLLLIGRAKTQIEDDELKCCTFKPNQVNHLVPIIYAIPSNSRPNYDRLKELRRQIHLAYLLSLDKPLFRYSQRIINMAFRNLDEQAGYLCNVHSGIVSNSGSKGGSRNIIEGTYTYHHYNQDRANDNGWGCAYRSLQTIISWYKHQGYIYSPDVDGSRPTQLAAASGADANQGQTPASSSGASDSLRLKLSKESRSPTHEEIQSVLVEVGDKQASFIGSKKWIGSQEVCYVLNHLYNLDSKFISVSSGSELVYKARDLGQHFGFQSTPVMIGGGVLAHTIIGLDFNEKNGDISYLILDPHYTGAEDLSIITKKGWCGWKKNSFWDKNAFYNLCLPQRPIEF